MNPARPLLALIALSATLATPALAQINKAPLSPRVQTSQQVGLTQVDLDYGRPSVRGREIFGALEPYGKVWRTGANASTKITFAHDVEVGGNDVPAGTYGLYTIPEEKSWTLILSRNSKRWGAGGYDPAEDQLRVEVQATRVEALRESLSIDFQGFHAHGADLVIAWEHTQVAVPVVFDTDERTMAEIDEKVRNATGDVSGQTYFDAAMYLYAKGESMDEVKAWIARAVELNPSAFWQVYARAEIAHAMGETELATAEVTRALEMAKASRAGDFGYVAKCSLLLAKLRKG